jgi:hypothetical protein
METDIFKPADINELQKRKSPVLRILREGKEKIVSKEWICETYNFDRAQVDRWIFEKTLEGVLRYVITCIKPTRLQLIVAWFKRKRVETEYEPIKYQILTEYEQISVQRMWKRHRDLMKGKNHYDTDQQEEG